MAKSVLNSILTVMLLVFFSTASTYAQTDADAIMMTKNNFCTGLMYSNNKWTNYWEGTLKRDNENLGAVSANMYAVMGNYGVTNKLNLLFGMPYMQTKASAGTLHGFKGFQDLSLWVKWNPIEMDLGKGLFSVYAIGGVSFPTTNYIADYLPLSIGLHTTNLSLRGMVDYQIGNFFVTASGTYVVRSNVTIDRSAYYTTEQHLTNVVDMPNVSQYQLRSGYRSSKLIAEAVLSNWTTLGGFDITRNNMPFPSNRMNATTLGVNFKYEVQAVSGLSLIGGASGTVAGRNVGQTTNINAGVFYILDFSHKKKPETKENDHSNTPVKAN